MPWTGSEELILKYENYLRPEEVPLTDFSFKSRVLIIKLKHLVFIFDSFAIYHLQNIKRHSYLIALQFIIYKVQQDITFLNMQEMHSIAKSGTHLC